MKYKGEDEGVERGSRQVKVTKRIETSVFQVSNREDHKMRQAATKL